MATETADWCEKAVWRRSCQFAPNREDSDIMVAALAPKESDK